MYTVKSRVLSCVLLIRKSTFCQKATVRKKSEKAYICFKTRLASTRDYMVKGFPRKHDFLGNPKPC